MKQRLTAVWTRLPALVALAIRRLPDARVAIAGWRKSVPPRVASLLVGAILAAGAGGTALRRSLAPVVRRPLAPHWRDLVAVAALALVALVVALVPVGGWIKAVAVLPLVLVLPGYALAAALFPTAVIDRDERLVLVFAFSVGASALGGLLLQLVLPLGRPSWAVLLFLLTLAAGCVALVRRGEPPTGDVRARAKLPRVAPLAAATIIAALVIAGWGIAIATGGAHRQLDDSHFSSLWVVPQRGGIATSGEVPVSIGVSNQEGRDASYLLRVERDGITLLDWRIHLVPNQQWQRGLAAPTISGRGPLLVELYRDGELLRHVKIGAPS